MEATARIITLEGNFLVAVPVSYNTPLFFFMESDMKTISRQADEAEWVWATTEWSSPLERGSWDISNDDYLEIQEKLRQERREKAFLIMNDERSSTEEVEENGNSYVTLWRRLSQEECDTIYNAADGIDDWTSLLSIGGNGGKSYTSEYDIPEGNYTCVDVTVSVTNFISGFTAYFMK